MQRAFSDTRKAACQRALLSAKATASQGILHGYPGSAAPPLSRSNSSSGHATPLSATPARGGGGGGGGRLRVQMRGAGSSGSRPESPFRGREDGAADGGAADGGGGDGQWGNRPSAQAGLGWADSGRWSNNTGPSPHQQNAGFDAPTAPYRGSDGVSQGERAERVRLLYVLAIVTSPRPAESM